VLEQNGMYYNDMQCKGRFKTLSLNYQKCMDFLEETGELEPFRYFEEFDAVMEATERQKEKRVQDGQEVAWTDERSKLLIGVYCKKLHKFQDRSVRRRGLWNEVAAVMRSKGQQVNYQQCASRWSTLCHAYRRTLICLARSGELRLCPHFHELKEVLSPNDEDDNMDGEVEDGAVIECVAKVEADGRCSFSSNSVSRTVLQTCRQEDTTDPGSTTMSDIGSTGPTEDEGGVENTQLELCGDTETTELLPEPHGVTTLPDPESVTKLPEPDSVTKLPEPDGVTKLTETDSVTRLPEPDSVTKLPEPDSVTKSPVSICSHDSDVEVSSKSSDSTSHQQFIPDEPLVSCDVTNIPLHQTSPTPAGTHIPTSESRIIFFDSSGHSIGADDAMTLFCSSDDTASSVTPYVTQHAVLRSSVGDVRHHVTEPITQHVIYDDAARMIHHDTIDTNIALANACTAFDDATEIIIDYSNPIYLDESMEIFIDSIDTGTES